MKTITILYFIFSIDNAAKTNVTCTIDIDPVCFCETNPDECINESTDNSC